ncbi:helix-turn-helix transcriptional regulator [Aeromicrobium sp. P5_D10]
MDPAAIVDLLSSGLTHDADQALASLNDADDFDGDSVLATAAFLRVLTCRFDDALDTAHALDLRPTLSPLAAAARDLAVAVCAGVVTVGSGPSRPGGPFGEVTAVLEIEAAMSSGWISRAADIAGEVVADGLILTPSAAWSAIALARARSFEGRFGDADRLVSRVLDSPLIGQWPQMQLLARGARIFVDGHLGRTDAVLTGLHELCRPGTEPRDHDYIHAGAWVMAAFGAHAIGRLDDAAKVILSGGGGEYLPRLQIVDRLYGYEILVDHALARADLDAARSWSERAVVLPVQGHMMASAALGRIQARLALASADTATGIEASADSGLLAALVGSDLEVIRARIIESSGRLAAGDRIRGIDELEDMARRAGAAGATAVKEWAERELRSHGRRLRNVPGFGWETLSSTQQHIAQLAAAGLRNREIAAALWLSDKTVESHVATILSALGTTNRVGIGREIGGAATVPPHFDDVLTARQREVAHLVARGHTNAEISTLLGISEKTVEKHVAGLFERLGVRTRSAIAARVRGAGSAPDLAH